ncbi:alpha-mannosidase [Calothrix sp. UHCC 0171]|uniref:alpha-mannosidase n=1 Tax=Calothrix sp. UHCC 0171 TaxID=3110245 RepID=UPI002B204A5D|nr:alpha-mannosidase [Calothrix sp. UHCC 0171]MEA5569571.1 alpha-mannosidase [Calothrix sp. UHCC 0171]
MTSSVSTADIQKINAVIEQLRALSQVDVQHSWRYSEVDFTPDEVFAADISAWKCALINEKGHIARDKGRKTLWLAQTIVVPHSLHSCYPLQDLSLRLALVWWADAAEVYVDGKLVCAGDLFDFSPRVLLSSQVTPGNCFTVAIRLVTPGHDQGALMRSRLLYENINYDALDTGFIADEVAVIQQYLTNFDAERLCLLQAALAEVNYYLGDKSKIDCEQFPKILFGLRENLKEFTSNIFPSKIFLLGHAHLDMAWLWRVEETWRAAQNTFTSVLNLQAEFPELIFCHSTPALYAWVEKNRPDLFAKIQAQVQTGKWEVLGGFWIEPDLNLISGESIARQLLYGQRYTQEKFGRISPIVWVPDTFGFCWTLPQFMQQAGIEYFVTQKLRWNDTNKFPLGAFWWQSPDGSQVFSYMSGIIGEGIDPIKMAAYACEWQTQTGIGDTLWLPGVGDHGGGPTRDMLEVTQRWQQSQFFPDLEFTTAENYLRHLQELGEGKLDIETNPSAFPTWNDELYLEFHRGCFTTHGEQKRFNRHCENLLYEAELFATWAKFACGLEYPHQKLETAWKKLLFNQFHDILPGSSITEVYTDALPEWQEVETTGRKILQDAFQAIAFQSPLPEPPYPGAIPVFVFNSLNWQRSQVVTLHLSSNVTDPGIFSTDGKQLHHQLSKTSKLLFLAENIPAIGYKIFWLLPEKCKNSNRVAQFNTSILRSKNKLIFIPEKMTLENEFLRVIVDKQTGDLTSIFDRINHREILNGAGNQLQAFQDSGQYWDAWNIDPNYPQHPLPASELKSIEFIEQGEIQISLRVVRQIGRSQFRQDYILETGSPILKIVTQVDWQERHVMVKAAFPLTITSDFATYEIPCGAIRRPTKPQTPVEKAKWEVSALRWADLTEVCQEEISLRLSPSPCLPSPCQYGVSLLNDCKYGYDATPNQLRLTLLRSPEWPDSEADKGIHEFTYAVYPHAGSWEAAQTVRQGYELNLPLHVVVGDNIDNFPQNAIADPSLPNVPKPNSIQDGVSFLNLSAENLVLMALKPAEDDPETIVIRCYECHGKSAEMHFSSDFGCTLAIPVDLLERPLSNSDFSSPQNIVTIHPWKITSFKVIGYRE